MNLGQTLQIKDIALMKDICRCCHENFTSHSFNYVCSTLEGGSIFYTKITNSTQYDDTVGIVNHCANYLNHTNPLQWTWIIDFADFGLKHTLGLNTGIQLSRLINRFGRLKHFIVINSNIFVDQILKIVKLTLNKDYHNCIQIIHSGDAFSKEIERWTCDNKDLLKGLIQLNVLSSSNKQ
jgi:hypothetical protein